MLPSDVRLWQGDSRGRWEGRTLVIDTTNFSAKSYFRGLERQPSSGRTLSVESPKTAIDYEITVSDTSAWTRPWTAVVHLKQSSDRMFEYACHEGNDRTMTDMLLGARAAERSRSERPPTRSRAEHRTLEVLRDHVRLPCESGRLARVRRGFSRSWRLRCGTGRFRRRGRQHVFCYRERGSGGAPDHSSSRAAESRRENHRHRLLCHPSAGRSRVSSKRPARGSKRRETSVVVARLRSRTLDLRSLRRRRRQLRRGDSAWRRGTNRVHAAGADRVCGAVFVLHHPDDERRAGQCADRKSFAGSGPRCGGRFQRNRAHGRPSRIVWPRPGSAVVVD